MFNSNDIARHKTHLAQLMHDSEVQHLSSLAQSNSTTHHAWHFNSRRFIIIAVLCIMVIMIVLALPQFTHAQALHDPGQWVAFVETGDDYALVDWGLGNTEVRLRLRSRE